MTPALTALAATLLTAYPYEYETPSENPPPPAQQEDAADWSAYSNRRHFELTMGFTGGLRNETTGDYTYLGGSADDIPGAQALASTFMQAPFDRVTAYGLAWELRYVTQHVRFTTGFQKPFANFRLADVIYPTEVGGVVRDVGARSLSLWDLRFGLGAEYSFKYVAPFADIVGDVQSVTASLTVDGKTAEYKAWNFGFTARAGVRVQLGDSVFLAPVGEVGLGGPVRWAVALHGGWVIPAS